MSWRELSRAVAGARARFAAQAAAPRRTQETLLHGILKRHAGCDIGRRHAFQRIRDLDHYRQALPVVDYERLRAPIDAMARGERAVLVDEPLRAFELTGGSSGGAKLIPLTASGLANLQQGLHAWLDDLCIERPALMTGSSYWSISPAARAAQHTAGGTPVGVDSDAEYFGEAAAHVAGLLSVSPAVAHLAEIGLWRRVTLQALLSDPRLALVSVWSPTFWLELCRHAVGLREELVAAIAAGRWTVVLPDALRDWLPAPAADPRRAASVDAALSAVPPDWGTVWPQLSMISCWTHASAQPWAVQLAKGFPAIEIQGKGLLATEGMVSLPLCDGGDPVAAIGSTVLEFEDETGHSHACDQVEQGGRYTVVMTTSAGLYRYRLGDQVEVTGFWHRTPRLRLLGRTTADSDLCGEKLTEAFVMRCWQQVVAAGPGVLAGITGRLVPIVDPVPGYRLLLDADAHSAAAASRLAVLLDDALRSNPQYAYARDLGQLAPLQALRVSRFAARLQSLALARGQRLGDAKPAVLGRAGEPDLAKLPA